MPVFNGRNWTLADFLPFKFIENWDAFWGDVIAEMTARVQGVGNALHATSNTSSVAIGVGSKSLTVETGKGFSANLWVVASDAANSANCMTGCVTSYNASTGALILSVPAGGTTGGGTPSAWVIGISGAVGPAGPSFTGGSLSSVINETAATLASASTVAIGAAGGNYLTITGTTAITAFDTVQAGAERVLRFAGALTLTHNATSLILPTAANVTTAVGDIAVMRSEGAGNWRCVSYTRASGSALLGSGPFSDILVVSANTTVTSASVGKQIEITGSSPVTLSVAASSVGKGSFGVLNLSAAYAAIAASSGTINAVTSWRLAPGEGCIVTSDGSKLDVLGQGGSYSTATLDPAKKGSAVTLSGANLTATGSASGNGAVLIVSPLPVGDWAWEILLTSASGTWAGIATAAANLASYVGADANSWGYGYNGTRSHAGDAAYGSAIPNGGTLMVLCRVTAGAGGTFDFKMFFQVGGVVQGGGDPVAGTAPAWSGTGVAALYPAWSDGASGDVPVGILRFSKSSWSQSPASASYAQIP